VYDKLTGVNALHNRSTSARQLTTKPHVFNLPRQKKLSHEGLLKVSQYSEVIKSFFFSLCRFFPSVLATSLVFHSSVTQVSSTTKSLIPRTLLTCNTPPSPAITRFSPRSHPRTLCARVRRALPKKGINIHGRLFCTPAPEAFPLVRPRKNFFSRDPIDALGVHSPKTIVCD